MSRTQVALATRAAQAQACAAQVVVQACGKAPVGQAADKETDLAVRAGRAGEGIAAPYAGQTVQAQLGVLPAAIVQWFGQLYL